MNGTDAGIVGAVVVAGQKVLVLGAEARVVGLHAGVDLALDGGNTGIQNATVGSVSMLKGCAFISHFCAAQPEEAVEVEAEPVEVAV